MPDPSTLGKRIEQITGDCQVGDSSVGSPLFVLPHALGLIFTSITGELNSRLLMTLDYWPTSVFLLQLNRHLASGR